MALGVILQGETAHAQHLGQSVTDALQQISLEHGIPVIHAVLSLKNEAQARKRCLEDEINRGTEAARAAIEMANLIADLREIAMGKRHVARGRPRSNIISGAICTAAADRKRSTNSGSCARPSPACELFAQPLIEGMLAHLPEIDERITRYCENYEFRRISAVDRNVLRLAIFEMFYRDDIPPVVSINEAIELAKIWRTRFRPIC